MKRILLLCLFLSIANKIFSQDDTKAPGPSVKADYLQKSKNKKTVAWVLLATGTAMMVTGSIMIASSDENEYFLGGPTESAIIGAALVSTGLVLDIVSIPFFITSAKYKRSSLSLSFKKESALQIRRGSIVQTALPSVSLVMRL
jgi:hypothetical protein